MDSVSQGTGPINGVRVMRHESGAFVTSPRFTGGGMATVAKVSVSNRLGQTAANFGEPFCAWAQAARRRPQVVDSPHA